MTPERIYALLVEANPVQDPDDLLERLDHGGRRLHLVDSRRADMQTEERFDTNQTTRRTPWTRGLGIALASLAVVIAVVVAVIAIISNQPDVTADGHTSNSQRALDAVDEFVAALSRGDIDEVEAVMEPSGELSAADRAMWGFNAELFAAGRGFDTGTCTAETPEGATLIAVACDVTFGDPLHAELGLDQLVMPFQYFSDTGRLGWRPFQGGDFSEVNRASVEYLRAFQPAEYEANCDPSKYEFGDVNFDQGLALTPECGRVIAPVIDDIAQWVADGRPQPTD